MLTQSVHPFSGFCPIPCCARCYYIVPTVFIVLLNRGQHCWGVLRNALGPPCRPTRSGFWWIFLPLAPSTRRGTHSPVRIRTDRNRCYVRHVTCYTRTNDSLSPPLSRPSFFLHNFFLPYPQCISLEMFFIYTISFEFSDVLFWNIPNSIRIKILGL